MAKRLSKTRRAIGDRREAGVTGARSRRRPYLELEPKKSERSIYRRAIEIARKKGSEKEAAALLLQSHRAGDRRATYALATWYIHGRYFSVDSTKAFRFLKASSKAGIPEAWFDLGHSYEIGFGTQKSPTKAFEAYIEAARRGDREAQQAVVRCVYWGIGIKRNKSLAGLLQDIQNGSGT